MTDEPGGAVHVSSFATAAIARQSKNSPRVEYVGVPGQVDNRRHAVDGASMGNEALHALDAQWRKVSGLLRAEIGEAAYRSWLKPIAIRGERNGLVTMAVPTRFMRDWVAAHYSDRLRTLWGSENPSILGVDIVVQTERPAPINGNRPAIAVPTAGGDTAGGCLADCAAEPVDALGHSLGAALDTRFTFERFVVGKPNEFAYAAACRRKSSCTASSGRCANRTPSISRISSAPSTC